MASRIVILPGKNPVLQRIVQHLAGFDDVHVFDSANAALWHIRQSPPHVVVADLKLEDMTAAEFVEILPNLAPATRLILSGARSPEIARAIQGTKVEVISPDDNIDHSVWAIYQALGMAPPAPRTATGSLQPAPSAPAAPAASGVLPPATPPPVAPPAPPAVASVPVAAASALRTVDTPLPQSAAPAATMAALPDGRATSNGTGTPTARPIPPAITNAAGRSGIGVVPKPSTPARPAVSPSPRAETPPPPAPGTAMRGGGPLIIRPQQEASIRALLKTLVDDSGAQAVMLSDTAGMVLMEVGELQRIMTHMLGMLLATNFSTAAELARQLGEQEASALYFHEGNNYDIYAFNVGFRFILTLTFDKQIGASKLGAVWVYAKRVTRQLQQILGS